MNPHEAYYRSLPPEEMQLVILQEILYEGSWDEMVEDLIARKEGKPFVFKLQTRIDDDLKRIERLRAYERAHGAHLGEYVPREEPREAAPERAHDETRESERA
jgi:hypothetical protein